MDKPVIGITMGDPAGIGAEIAVKALGKAEIYERCIPIVVGSKIVMEDAINFIPSNLELNVITDVTEAKGAYGKIDLLDLDNIKFEDFKYGEVNPLAGKASVEYIFKAIDLAMEEKMAAVVTGPINKEAIHEAGFNYAGHTEIFADRTNTKDYAMMLTDNNMRVIHVSTHVSLREACDRVMKERILTVIRLAHQTMLDLGIENPQIAVAGLNPHAGEQGLFGNEEIEEIIPAVNQAKEEGINVKGPIPPDTVFSKVRGGLYDVVVVMYHDQGHIPMKVTAFQYNKKTDKWSSVTGVNTTVGLPIIRTSVDHGTAFDKAGEGRANEESLVEAIEMAVDLSGN